MVSCHSTTAPLMPLTPTSTGSSPSSSSADPPDDASSESSEPPRTVMGFLGTRTFPSPCLVGFFPLSSPFSASSVFGPHLSASLCAFLFADGVGETLQVLGPPEQIRHQCAPPGPELHDPHGGRLSHALPRPRRPRAHELTEPCSPRVVTKSPASPKTSRHVVAKPGCVRHLHELGEGTALLKRMMDARCASASRACAGWRRDAPSPSRCARSIDRKIRLERASGAAVGVDSPPSPPHPGHDGAPGMMRFRGEPSAARG